MTIRRNISNINVNFIDRYSVDEGDLSKLFEEAIDSATEKINIGGAELYVISVEHLTAVKISTFERKIAIATVNEIDALTQECFISTETADRMASV